MFTRVTKNLLFVFPVLVLFVLTSCQKGVDIDLDNPPPIPEEVKDSTLLIKSIKAVWDIGLPNEDSLIEYYSYDTINRKLTITWRDENGDYVPDSSKVELSYNTKGHLVNASYHYPAGYVPWDFDYNTINIEYDGNNVLQKVMVKYMDGSQESAVFNRTTILADNGYQLTWNETMLEDDSIFRKAIFDKEGKAVVSYIEHYYHPTPGLPEIDTTIARDSIAYDAGGSVIQVFTRSEFKRTNELWDYKLYEFTRQTKGDQLYNQRKLIMNGIDNMPFGDYDSMIADAFGVLSFSLNYENWQYSKYPCQTVRARMYDGSFKNFTSNPTFDNKNRLTKFTGFFHDYDLEPIEYSITYYK